MSTIYSQIIEENKNTHVCVQSEKEKDETGKCEEVTFEKCRWMVYRLFILILQLVSLKCFKHTI